NLGAVSTTGTVSATWNPGATGGAVNTFAVDGSTVYVGGAFTTVGGAARAGLAAVDTSGSLTSWNPGATGGAVNSLAVLGSTIYVGGSFTNLGGGARTGLGAVDTSGSL